MININILPATKHVEANDKLAESIFYYGDIFYEQLITSGKRVPIVEKSNHRKYGSIVTTVGLSLINDYTNTKPLSQYDRSVLAACISEWEFGNKYTTPNIIYRHLTGKNKSSDTPEPSQSAAILESIRKLMGVGISIDMSDTSETLKYKNCSHLVRTNPILPIMYDSVTLTTGQKSIFIHFLAESPILTVAKSKKQLLTYDLKLLNVPKQHNSVDTIAVKNYVLHRIIEIKAHRLTPTITFDDVFEKCRLAESNSKKKMDTRKVIMALMNHLQNCDEILNYEVKKKHNKFQSITFNYKAKSK